ncbi:MAG: Tfp pilus assembly protein FimT/FimU [Chthoniobacterales bacterium]
MEVVRFRQELRRSAFTLMELLVVMAIIAILLVAIVPAVTSLSKSSGRKAAMNNLMGAIDQARSLAIKDGESTYVAFADRLPKGSSTNLSDRYSYRSYAIFEDDAANPGSLKQIVAWRTLPVGISFRSGSLGYLAKTKAFPFTPGGAGVTSSFPFLQFTANGEIDPACTPSAVTGTVQIAVFEGFVDPKNGERDTNASKPTETVAVNRLTGRPERM